MFKINSTPEADDIGGERQDVVRNIWKKLIECEERVKFWKRMIEWGVGIRELEHMGDGLKEKFRSESMQSGKSEREVIMLVMSLKLRDEKKHQKKLIPKLFLGVTKSKTPFLTAPPGV